MGEKILDPNELITMTRDAFHACYQGDLNPWINMLNEKSIYIGNATPILVGRQAIEREFSKYTGSRVDQILQEDYYAYPVSEDVWQVYGQIILRGGGEYNVINRFSIIFQRRRNRIQIVQQQNSYEYMKADSNGKYKHIQICMEALDVVHKLLGENREETKLTVKNGEQLFFINPYSVLYIQGQGKKNEIVCLDKVVSTSSTLGELKQMLPEFFCQIHRSYIVNSYYVESIRRFEVEMESGEILPVPEHSYTKVRSQLERMMKIRR